MVSETRYIPHKPLILSVTTAVQNDKRGVEVEFVISDIGKIGGIDISINDVMYFTYKPQSRLKVFLHHIDMVSNESKLVTVKVTSVARSGATNYSTFDHYFEAVDPTKYVLDETVEEPMLAEYRNQQKSRIVDLAELHRLAGMATFSYLRNYVAFFKLIQREGIAKLPAYPTKKRKPSEWHYFTYTVKIEHFISDGESYYIRSTMMMGRPNTNDPQHLVQQIVIDDHPKSDGWTQWEGQP